jgi:hypothetical protein
LGILELLMIVGANAKASSSGKTKSSALVDGLLSLAQHFLQPSSHKSGTTCPKPPTSFQIIDSATSAIERL